MSLIQRALDQAGRPEPENKVPSSAPVSQLGIPETEKKVQTLKMKNSSIDSVVHEPRLNSIRFYETLDKETEQAIQGIKAAGLEKKDEERSVSSNKFLIGAIAVILLLSLIISRFFMMPSSKGSLGAVPPAAGIVEPKEAREATSIVAPPAFLVPKPIIQYKYTLTGITSSGDTILALVNNQVVGTGDRLREKAVVKSVSENQVVLQTDGGKLITLSI